jgi:hypothetical protein
MKRLIAATSFAVLALPAFAATGLPFEQTQLDRALPQVKVTPAPAAAVPGARAPYEQLVIDRALPQIEPRRAHVAAFAGGSGWTNDHNIVAPAG